MKTMRRLSYVAPLLTVALLVLTPAAGAQQEDQGGAGTTAPNTWQVSIGDFFFDPADAAVGAGDSIVFVNEGAEAHTVTSDDGQFDSGTLNPGESYTVTFEGEGTITYHCSIHPEMVGSVTVGGGSGGDTPSAGESDSTASEPEQPAGETIYIPGGTLTHYEST